jgi:peptidoglycan/LPS O-acetylase OafA/YrhL
MKLDNIQTLRAAAALMVVAFHAASVWGPEAYIVTANKPLLAFLFGHSGVELFFVLSGFIIAHAAQRSGTGLKALISYARRRAWRIYPMVFVAAGFGLSLLLSAHQPVSADLVFSSFTLLPLGPQYPIVLWSLSHEILFYGVFAIYFVAPRAVTPLVIILGLISAACYLIWPEAAAANPLRTLASPYNLLFGMGLLVHKVSAIGQPSPRKGWLWLLAGFAVFSATASYDATMLQALAESEAKTAAMHMLTPFYGFGAALLLTGAVALPPATGCMSRWLVTLGDASFSIYLFHTFGIQFIARVLLTSGWTEPYSGFLMLAAFGTLAGLGAWALVERPLLSMGRSAKALPRNAAA